MSIWYYLNMIDVNVVIQMFKDGKSETEIAANFGVTRQAINHLLKREGLKQTNYKFSSKITSDIEEVIRFLHRQNKTSIEISRVTGVSATGIRAFFKRISLKPNIKSVDHSRPCVICQKSFIPKYQDGVKKDRYKTCSSECLHLHLSNIKSKYTKSDIDLVIELKNKHEFNTVIEEKTGVNINKIKEIVKEHDIFLDKDMANKNVWQGKLESNPNCMADMRSKYQEISQSDESLEEVKAYLAECGYEYVSGFISKSRPFVVKCLKCKKDREAYRIQTILKNSCMYCSHTGISKQELDLLEWVQIYHPDAHKFKFPNRTPGAREIDIYIPSMKLGIEYCGLYWHTENIKNEHEDDNKHYKKMLAANALGVRLITIFGDEWTKNEAQIKSFLVSTFGKNQIKVNARDCIVKNIDSKIGKEFQDLYHMQGGGNDDVYFGIYDDKEDLLGVMSAGRHPQRFSNNDSSIYLNRLTFKTDVTIRGGSGKLFSALKQYAVGKSYKSIISWSDNRWSEGNVYKKLGFIFSSQRDKGRGLKDGSIWPETWYVFKGRRISKHKMKTLNLTDEDVTKIYDCGKKRWIFKLI